MRGEGDLSAEARKSESESRNPPLGGTPASDDTLTPPLFELRRTRRLQSNLRALRNRGGLLFPASVLTTVNAS
jgi:hypothetical protein